MNIERKIQNILPPTEYEKIVKVAKKSEQIARDKGYSEEQCRECYVAGLLFSSKDFIHEVAEELNFNISEAVGLLNYNRYLVMHNNMQILETDNPYALIVRTAELEVMKNEMD